MPDEAYERAYSEFKEQELVDLVWAIATINAWNRINVGLKTVPGDYQPPNAR